jgi:hypothetical protein
MKITGFQGSLENRPYLKNILLAAAACAVGFILLGLTFMLFALVSQFADLFRSTPPAPGSGIDIIRYAIFFVLVLGISWAVFRFRMPVFVKAGFAMVPVASVLVVIGILLNSQPVLSYVVGGILTLGLLYLLYRLKSHWLYFFSISVVAVALFIGGLTGMEF